MEDIYNLIVDQKYGIILIVEEKEIENLQEKWPNRFRRPTEEEVKWFTLMPDFGRHCGSCVDLFYFDYEEENWKRTEIEINLENIRTKPPWKRDFLFSNMLYPEM